MIKQSNLKIFINFFIADDVANNKFINENEKALHFIRSKSDQEGFKISFYQNKGSYYLYNFTY